VTDADKADVTPKLDALKEALKGTDIEAIKTAKDELQKVFYDIAGRIYQEQGAAAQQADVQGEGTNAGGANPDDNVVDVDYTDVN
ncbi:MAG: molecular chaperone DnaK, partial [Oscillospiraceae bacterium]|nr:molecular chaperone DnaK [Oscillospiraceae bacterium]